MPLEIEKKYRLTPAQRRIVKRRLPRIGARYRATEFEENTIYQGDGLNPGNSALRLRRIGNKAILTHKTRFPTSSAIKHQQEEETRVSNPQAMDSILAALGFTPALVYEKRRERWRLGSVEIVVDELPFGLFMEIEGPEEKIREVESKLGVKGLRAERRTYPQLTRERGRSHGMTIEARFNQA